MKKLKAFNLGLIFAASSVITFQIVIGVGYVIKNLDLTILLFLIPILLGAAAWITSIVSLIKKDVRKLLSIILLAFSTITTTLMALYALMMLGLRNLT
jgi:hypothetical protein